MGDNNILPRGGFLRGVLAALTLIFFVFVGLASIFPFSEPAGPTPTPVIEMTPAPTQPALESTESAAGITMPADASSPLQLGETPAPFEAAAPEVAVQPTETAPVSSMSVLDTMPATEDTPDESVATGTTVVEAPEEPVIAPVVPTVAAVVPEATPDEEMVATEEPTALVETETPAVDVFEGTEEQASGESDGIQLTGQTIIAADVEEEVSEPEKVEATSPFEAYSATFVEDNTLPLLSFILRANTVAEVEVVAKLPAPLTVAVHADNPEASAMITAYRALGGEVVVLLPKDGSNALRSGGDPTQVSDQIDAILVGKDGVIGLFDGLDGDLNQDTRMLDALMAKLAETGHAIVTVNGLGLNRASAKARESSIPVTEVTRAVEVDDGTISAIRDLDKIVLQMGNQKSATVFAPATPDMLFALNFWLESQKAKTVTIAPLSASILRN